MPYSAVTQPRAWPLSHGGKRSSRVAVTSTWVSPNFTKHEPSAYLTTPRSSDTARNSSGCRRLGRMHCSGSVCDADGARGPAAYAHKDQLGLCDFVVGKGWGAQDIAAM